MTDEIDVTQCAMPRLGVACILAKGHVLFENTLHRDQFGNEWPDPVGHVAPEIADLACENGATLRHALQAHGLPVSGTSYQKARRLLQAGVTREHVRESHSWRARRNVLPPESPDEPDRTHGGNHAPLLNGGLLAPGFCDGCDEEREGCRACRILASGIEGSTQPHTCLSHVLPPGSSTGVGS